MEQHTSEYYRNLAILALEKIEDIAIMQRIYKFILRLYMKQEQQRETKR